eukprot:2191404-Lingulodinium_polyedra.AAC.1
MTSARLPPVICEGAGETRAICQAGFQHGERACRLARRRMFHGECWGTGRTSFAADRRRARFCPNCRRAGAT